MIAIDKIPLLMVMRILYHITIRNAIEKCEKPTFYKVFRIKIQLKYGYEKRVLADL